MIGAGKNYCSNSAGCGLTANVTDAAQSLEEDFIYHSKTSIHLKDNNFLDKRYISKAPPITKITTNKNAPKRTVIFIVLDEYAQSDPYVLRYGTCF